MIRGTSRRSTRRTLTYDISLAKTHITTDITTRLLRFHSNRAFIVVCSRSLRAHGYCIRIGCNPYCTRKAGRVPHPFCNPRDRRRCRRAALSGYGDLPDQHVILDASCKPEEPSRYALSRGSPFLPSRCGQHRNTILQHDRSTCGLVRWKLFLTGCLTIRYQDKLASGCVTERHIRIRTARL